MRVLVIPTPHPEPAARSRHVLCTVHRRNKTPPLFTAKRVPFAPRTSQFINSFPSPFWNSFLVFPVLLLSSSLISSKLFNLYCVRSVETHLTRSPRDKAVAPNRRHRACRS